MSDNLEIEVMSSKRQIKDFKDNNLVWRDMQNELLIWLEAFEIEKGDIVDNAASDNPSTASVLLHMGDLNGRAKAVRYMLSLPNLFLSVLEDRKDDTTSE